MKIFRLLWCCALTFCIFEVSASVSINGQIIDTSKPIIISKNNKIKNLKQDLEGALTDKKDQYISRIRYNKKIKLSKVYFRMKHLIFILF